MPADQPKGGASGGGAGCARRAHRKGGEAEAKVVGVKRVKR
jgi:hypothetical protein